MATNWFGGSSTSSRAGSSNLLGCPIQSSKVRKGTKRAAVAVAHTILVIAYHLLKEQTTYRELGSNYFDQHDKERVSRRLVQRLERLGYKISIEPAPPIESTA